MINGNRDICICNDCLDVAGDIAREQNIDLASFGPRSSPDRGIIELKPIFRGKYYQITDNSCFYLGPFRDPFNVIYNDHIAPAVAEKGISITRADEIFSTDVIIEDVWKGINSASFVIADVTGRNPNVMYEIGMAHTVGRPVLIISQTAEDIPFDLIHRRCLIYEYTPRGCVKLENDLAKTIDFLREAEIIGRALRPRSKHTKPPSI